MHDAGTSRKAAKRKGRRKAASPRKPKKQKTRATRGRKPREDAMQDEVMMTTTARITHRLVEPRDTDYAEDGTVQRLRVSRRVERAPVKPPRKRASRAKKTGRKRGRARKPPALAESVISAVPNTPAALFKHEIQQLRQRSASAVDALAASGEALEEAIADSREVDIESLGVVLGGGSSSSAAAAAAAASSSSSSASSAASSSATSNASLHERLQMAFDHCSKSEKFRKFARFEFFYSSVDAAYFEQNEFIDCLEHLGLGKVTHLSRREWAVVRRMMGRARRFSPAFLRDARRDLHAFRRDVHAVHLGKAVNSERFPFPVEEAGLDETVEGMASRPKRTLPMPPNLPMRLYEGQHVMALHPDSGDVHPGVIASLPLVVLVPDLLEHPDNPSRDAGRLPDGIDPQGGAHEGIAYRVKFESEGLGTRLVVDTEIMVPWDDDRQAKDDAYVAFKRHRAEAIALLTKQLAGEPVGLNGNLRSVPILKRPVPQPMTLARQETEQVAGRLHAQPPFPNDEGDLQQVSLLLRLLDRKDALVSHLRTMNDIAERRVLDDHARAGEPRQHKRHRPAPKVQRVSKTFQEQYAFVIVELEKTSKALETELSKLRLRVAATRNRGDSNNTSLASLPDLRQQLQQAAAQGRAALEEAVLRGDRGLPDLRRGESKVSLARRSRTKAERVWANFKRDTAAQRRRQREKQQREQQLQQQDADGDVAMAANDASDDEDDEDTDVVDGMIVGCLAMAAAIKLCSEERVPMAGLGEMLEAIRPKAPKNLDVFDSIVQSMSYIRESIGGQQ